MPEPKRPPGRSGSTSVPPPEVTRELLLHITPAVLGAVRRVIGHRHPEEEDLAQEALKAFIVALPNFRGECTLRHFARRIAVQRCIDGIRRSQTRRKGLELLANSTVASEHPQLVPQQRLRAAWNDALTQVSTSQAEALGLRYVLGYSVDEIAETAGVSRNTVKSRLRVAKDRLREKISSDPQLAELWESP